MQKYDDGSKFLVIKSLSYFVDGDGDDDPVMLKPIGWEEVKSFIKKTVVDYLG